MAKEYKKAPSFTTPRGVFVYPKLTEPDYGTKDHPQPYGVYSLKFRMSQADADAFLDQKTRHEGGWVTLRELHAAALEEARVAFAAMPVATRKKIGEVQSNDLYSVLYDESTEEPTGEVEFKFKMKASGEVKKGPRAGTKWTRKPDIFDARGRKMTGTLPSIWGGTEGKVSFAVRPFFVSGSGLAGLTRMLSAVQIIDLVSEGSRSADSYGFGAEDGFGYDPEDYQEEQAAPTSDSDTDDTAAGEEDF